jgi:hypothetical protein
MTSSRNRNICASNEARNDKQYLSVAWAFGGVYISSFIRIGARAPFFLFSFFYSPSPFFPPGPTYIVLISIYIEKRCSRDRRQSMRQDRRGSVYILASFLIERTVPSAYHIHRLLLRKNLRESPEDI